MGITPTTTTCMNPKEVSRAKTPTYIHCPSLCSRSSIPGGKGLYSKQIAEKIMEEQLVMTLVPPKQLQTSLRKYLHYWGGDRWVDPSCLDYLQEAKLQIFLGAS